MKATIVHVAPSTKRGIIEVTKQFGPLTSKIASGWMTLETGATLGTSFDLPDTCEVSTRQGRGISQS